ncbi:MAG: hypothetical protein R3357_13890 [Burkholderiales bacterium]|nr:hypothetical protein [Burkholderiales bacterium]
MHRSRIRLPAGVLAFLVAAGAAFAQGGEAPPRDAKRKPAAKAEKAVRTPPALEGECAYTGKRVVNSLARDDVDAAQKFMRFYEMFSCPAEHLRDAFRCAVEGGAPAPGKALSDRVDACWDKPPAEAKTR